MVVFFQVQYTFVYDALMEGKLSGNTAIPASRFNTKLTELIDEMKAGTEYDNHSSELVQQYEVYMYIYGVCMVYVWCMYGVCMVYVWCMGYPKSFYTAVQY